MLPFESLMASEMVFTAGFTCFFFSTRHSQPPSRMLHWTQILLGRMLCLQTIWISESSQNRQRSSKIDISNPKTWRAIPYHCHKTTCSSPNKNHPPVPSQFLPLAMAPWHPMAPPAPHRPNCCCLAARLWHLHRAASPVRCCTSGCHPPSSPEAADHMQPMVADII